MITVTLPYKEPRNWLLIGSIAGSVIVTAVFYSVSEKAADLFPYHPFTRVVTQLLLFSLCITSLWVLWKQYVKKKKKKYKTGSKLAYLLQANALYTESYVDSFDSSGKAIKEKYISDCARLGYTENEDHIVVRAWKDGNRWTAKMSQLDLELSAVLRLPVDNKVDTVSYTEYTFKKVSDHRISLTGTNSVTYNNSTRLPLNSNLSWNILKQPHLLLAGVTGSGKTTFINYLIICMKQMRGTVYVIDPKRSDLSSLQHYWGKEYVASEVTAIAKLTREVKDIMEQRFVDYKENADNFVYGYSFVDYGLNPIFLIFDELGAYRASAEKKVFAETMDNLTQIILKGREMGVFVVLSTQQPNANNIPTELRDNLSVRLAMGNMSSEAYRMVFGDSEGIQTVSGVGTGYIYLDGLGWEKPKYFEAPFLDYKNFDFIAEIQKYQQ